MTELFEKIQKIQIVTKQLANDLLAGAYHSAFKGKGMEFEEVREYQTGDDIRTIDWNVTARMHHPYVKVYREERELTTILMVDISASSRFGSHNRTKKELIAEVGAVIAFSAIKNNDKIGLILFSEEIELYLPPKKGLRNVLRVIRELLVSKPKKIKTDLSIPLSFLGRVQQKGTICFLISDFICDLPQRELSIISLHNDLIAIEVKDPCEWEFFNMNLVQLSDFESGKTKTIDTSNASVIKEQQQKMQERSEKLKTTIKQIGAGLVEIQTDQSYIDPLRKFFKLRKIRH
jgi:uncharacterized protein (DUF58 family)